MNISEKQLKRLLAIAADAGYEFRELGRTPEKAVELAKQGQSYHPERGPSHFNRMIDLLYKLAVEELGEYQ